MPESTPQASRPHMPDYHLPPAEAGEGLLDWSWGRERMALAHNYWVATSRPDDRPHAMPVWGIWLDEAFLFSTATGARKARNLRANPEVVVTTERADEAVIVEGRAAELDDAALLARFKVDYDAKYDWDMDTSQGGFWIVHPRVAFGFIERPDQFVATATRWTFEKETP